MRFFLFCLLFVEHHYSCNEKAVTKTACYSETPVLADPNWSDSSSVISGTAYLQQPLSPSLEGFDFPETSAINCSEHRRDGGEPECPLEMLAMQASMQGHGSALSKLWESLAQMLRQALCPQWQNGSLLELVSGKRSFAKITTKKDQKRFGEGEIKDKQRQRQGRQRRKCTELCLALATISTLDAGVWSRRIDCIPSSQCLGFGVAGSHQAKLSRCFADAKRDQAHGGEISKPAEQADHSRATLGYDPVGEGQKMLRRADRIQRCTSESMDGLPQGVHRLVDQATREIQRAGEAIHGADGQSKVRDAHCKEDHSRVECELWNFARRRSTSTCSGTGFYRAARIATASGQGPEGQFGGFAEAQDREDRTYRFIYGRRRRGRGGQTLKVENAQSFFVKDGSVLSCLRRLTRQPLRISFQVVEAYDARDHRAACHFEGQTAEDCKWHSVMWEENYVDPWQALTQAKNLAGSLVLESMSQDIIGFFCTLAEIGCHSLQPDRTPSPDPILEVQDYPVHGPTQEVPVWGHTETFCQLSANGIAVLSEGSEFDFAEEVELVTYGLLQTNLGKRSGSCPPTPYAIMEEATRLWEDFQRIADHAIIHLVKPQFEAPWKIVAIVELLSSLHVPPQDRVPTLRFITTHRDGYTREEAAYHTHGVTGLRILVEAELHTLCKPWHTVQCNLHIEKQISPLSGANRLQAGSLLHIFVHDDDDDIEQQTPAQTEWTSSTDLDRPHVTDLWCEGPDLEPEVPSGLDVSGTQVQEVEEMTLMQRPTPSDTSDAEVGYHFFHMRSQYITGHAHPSVTFNDVVIELWELPSYGLQALRQLHAVSFPPDFVPRSDYVFIAELNNDELTREYLDDVLCLVQLRFDTTPPSNDRRDSYRVIWLPPSASRDEILNYLRIQPACRRDAGSQCEIEVNHVRWREADSVIRQFHNGDFILVTIFAPSGDTPENTRNRFCLSERRLLQQHVILTDSSIESTDDSPSHHSPPETKRSRSRSRRYDDRSRSPEQDEGHDSPSLLQLQIEHLHQDQPYQPPQQRNGLCHPCSPGGITVGAVDSHFQQALQTLMQLQCAGDWTATLVTAECINISDSLQDADYRPCGFHAQVDDSTGIDFRGVFSLWQWLDTAIPEVQWYLPEDIPWHPATASWTQSFWDLEWADQLYIYTDGSAHRKRNTSTAAAAFFARQGEDWHFAGYLRQDLPGPPCPHRAELHGLLIGLHWVNHTLHRLSVTQGSVPDTHFAFDAT